MYAEEKDGEGLLTASEVAGMFGMSKRTVWRLAGGGQLPRPVKVGGLTRWLRSEIGATLEKVRKGRKL